MRAVLVLIAGLCAGAQVAAQAPAGKPPAAAPSAAGQAAPATGKTSLAVKCKRLYVGDGRVLSDAWLVVRNGKIQDVLAQGQPPKDLPILDASDKVVMPGIVSADSDLSAQGDAPYNVTPDFQAVESFDFTKRYDQALSGGVTSAYLSPGRARLVSGQGSVVKLHGNDLLHRVLAESACLRITLGKESTVAPALFEPTPAPTSDDPLLPARRQLPTARISQLHELTRTFAEAMTTKEHLVGPGRPEDQYEVSALQRAAKGQLPLRIAARTAADLDRALRFARNYKARVVLENPVELEKIAGEAAKDGVLATFRIPVRPGATNAGGEDKALEKSQPSLGPEAASKAVAAGIHVAIAPVSDEDLDDFLMVAAIAVRYGLSAEQALIAITSDAAKALGVDARVGTLSAGKDADFLVLSGEPFAVGTLVEKTFVDGAIAWQRERGAELLAVRASKIITGEGQTLRDGVVLCEGGKIKAIGEDLAIPYGTKVLRVDGVLVPGLIDACSHAGLSGQGQGVPNGSADQLVADAVAFDDPLLKQACAAGLTTVLVSGRDAGLVSGRVAALKTGAKDAASMVLKDVAAIRFVHDGVGPDSIRPLADAIGRGKQYVDTWAAYEKSLKEGTASRPVLQQPTEAPKEDAVTGTWEVESQGGQVQMAFKLLLKLEGTKVTGKAEIRGQRGGQAPPPSDIANGSFEGGQLKLEVRVLGPLSARLEATIEGDSLTGTLTMPIQQIGTLRISGKRTSREGGEATTPAAASNKPRIDQALEPLKALLEKKIPAIVRTTRGPAIEAIVQWFEDQKLPYVLQGAEDATEQPALLQKAKSKQVVLAPSSVARQGKKIVNAPKTLVESGAHVALCSDATGGSRYLPLHAAYAVRYGLDPDAALAALTIEPARMYLLDDRIGSLKRGKDADFVVFSGHPLETESRVQLVVVNGQVVVDERPTAGAGK